MVSDAFLWVLIAAAAVYGGAMVLASVRMVPEGHVGIVTGRSGERRVLENGLHMVDPFRSKTDLMPLGPVRMDGEVRSVITQDGWNISAHYQLNAKLVDELLVGEAGGDWLVVTKDAAERVLRTELENNDASDLRPRPQALDEGITEEINVLTHKWGVEVDWMRVTVRWAYAIPPAHVVHSP
jgi:regulator of protease activity HflC (stomatin/prohibitin superfamily)